MENLKTFKAFVNEDIEDDMGKETYTGHFYVLNKYGNIESDFTDSCTAKNQEEAEKILGKSLKESTIEEIEKAFKVAREQEAEPLKKIYKVFADTNNKFVRRAKTMNSAFSFVSIIFLVPGFMIWLARYCERMTKENKAKERAMMAQDTVQLTQTKEAQQKAQEQIQAIKLSQTVGSKPSMAGFAK